MGKTYMQIPRIESDEVIGFMNVDTTDFGNLTLADQIRHFEVEGYVLLPNILTASHIDQLKEQLADIEMEPKPYSDYQKMACVQPQWHSRIVAELIGYPPMISFLTNLMGPDIVFTRGFFQRTHPGSPGISMHTDGQPHGSSIFDYEGSSPRLLRVLYYLDDLTKERAPFRLIPRTHLSFHAQANPYLRYKSHPQEITLLAPAGSAVVIPSTLFHGTHPNTDSKYRELIQFGYRPAWAGPIQPVPEWDKELIANAPEQAKPFLQSPNTTGGVWGLEHKPKGMPTTASGINPDRWYSKREN